MTTDHAREHETVGSHSRRWRRQSTLSAHATTFKTRGSARRQVSSRRHRDLKLHQLRHLRTFVLTQYNSASLNRHIAQTYRFSQFSNGFVEIIAAEQTPESPQWFQGTADAVRQVLPHIRDWGIDTLLILSGDHLYRMDYRHFLERHHETDADVTVSVIPCEPRSASEFGLLKTDETGRIVEFKEKPKGDDLLSMRVDTTSLGLDASEAKRRPFLASMGIYVFKYDQLGTIAGGRSSADGLRKANHSLQRFTPRATCRRNMFDGYWEDIGTIGAFYRANLDLTTQIPKFNLFDAEAPVYTRARYLPPSKIEEMRNQRFDRQRRLHHQRREGHELRHRFAQPDLERRAARSVVHDGRRLLSDV